MAESVKTTAAASNSEQQGNSPARQLLAALTKASQDMERSVSDACEHVGRLNVELERFVHGQLEAADEQIEQFIWSKHEKLSTDKEKVISQLMEIRQEELQVLQQTGKQLRDALTEKLNELVSEFSTQIDENLKSFQTSLADTEKSVGQKASESRKEFKETIPSKLESIREEVGNEKSSLEELHTTYDEQLSQESLTSLEELVEHCANLKSRLQKEGEEYLGQVTSSVDELTSQQTESLNKRIESFSSMQKDVSERIQALSEADIDYLKELPADFKETGKEMAELHVGLHATTVRNLSLQYRTEILSAAQQAEDQLLIVKAELQSLLKNYQNQFTEQYESLFSKFEKSATELCELESEAPEQGKDNEVMEKLKSQFEDMKKSLNDETKSEYGSVEISMEKSYENFKNLLDNAKKEACDTVELSFHEYQAEFTKLEKSNEEQLVEMSKKLEELEQSVAEARELISALDAASLDF